MRQQPNKSSPPSKAPPTKSKKHSASDTTQQEKIEANPPQNQPEKDPNTMRSTRMMEMVKSMKSALSRVTTVKKEKGSPVIIEIDSPSSHRQKSSPHQNSAMDIEPPPPKPSSNTSKQPKIEKQMKEEALVGKIQVSKSERLSPQQHSKKRESSSAKKKQVKKEQDTGPKECETQTDPHPMGLIKVLNIREEQGEEKIDVLFWGKVTTFQRSVLEQYHIHALLDYYQGIINPKPKTNNNNSNSTTIKLKPTTSHNTPTPPTVRPLTRKSANKTNS